jgi:hypothetical protein
MSLPAALIEVADGKIRGDIVRRQALFMLRVEGIEQELAFSGWSRSGLRDGRLMDACVEELRERAALARGAWVELLRSNHALAPQAVPGICDEVQRHLGPIGENGDLWRFWTERLPGYMDRLENALARVVAETREELDFVIATSHNVGADGDHPEDLVTLEDSVAPTQRFSARHGYTLADPPIIVREDAPPELRQELLQIVYSLGFAPSDARSVVCRVLRVRPDAGNWSERPNIEYEVQTLLDGCEWFRVYDIIEALHGALKNHVVQVSPGRGQRAHGLFAAEINGFFREAGIGWQLIDGRVEVRGEEAFERTIARARDAIAETGRVTATSELHEAIVDLSRRPEPDVTGAIHHAMSALECVALHVTGDTKGTLGDWIKKHRERLPKPLDGVIEKAWGFASTRGRHVIEGYPPTRDEAELIVGIAAALAAYLSRLTPPSGDA